MKSFEQHMAELVHEVMYSPVRPTPNPRVGCRILNAEGDIVGTGIHGTHGVEHAEVIALQQAGSAARGGTAIVTLEPCNHTGKTGPCVDALLEAGVSTVVYGSADPTPLASGGAERLAGAGLSVIGQVLQHETDYVIEPWWFAQNNQRPFVTLKIATTLDGYVAASDGSSRWITSEKARLEVHHLRARVDAVAVGTGTAVADDPLLDVRLPGVWPQPRRYVVGQRTLPQLRMVNPQQVATRNPHHVLSQMFEDGVRHVMIEGGATLASSFISAGLVDQLLWFTAPKILGSGTSAIANLGISNINEAIEWHLREVKHIGSDVMLDLRPQRVSS